MAEKKEVRLNPEQAMGLYRKEQSDFEAAQKKRQTLHQMLRDTIGAEDSLKELDKTDKSAKIMLSLGAGVYAEATIESKTVKRGLANGVLLDSTSKETIKSLETRKEEITKDLKAISEEEARLMKNINSIALGMEKAKADAQQRKKE